VEVGKHLESCRISPSFDYDIDPVFFLDMSLVEYVSKKRSSALKKMAVVISETLTTCRHSKSRSNVITYEPVSQKSVTDFVTKCITKKISICKK
jgi:hypothetical protein